MDQVGQAIRAHHRELSEALKAQAEALADERKRTELHLLDVQDDPFGRRRVRCCDHDRTSLSPSEMPSERAILMKRLSAGTVLILLIASLRGTNLRSGG